MYIFHFSQYGVLIYGWYFSPHSEWIYPLPIPIIRGLHIQVYIYIPWLRFWWHLSAMIGNDLWVDCLDWIIQWRHNERDRVSNHQPHDCLLNRLFMVQIKGSFKAQRRGLCAVNSPVTSEFPAQRDSSRGKWFHLMTPSWVLRITTWVQILLHFWAALAWLFYALQTRCALICRSQSASCLAQNYTC